MFYCYDRYNAQYLVSRARGFCAATRTLYTVSVGQPIHALLRSSPAKGMPAGGGTSFDLSFCDFKTFLFFCFLDKNTVQIIFCMVLFF